MNYGRGSDFLYAKVTGSRNKIVPYYQQGLNRETKLFRITNRD